MPAHGPGVASDIGRRLRQLRELLGETQVEFGGRFGRAWKQVSAWENGRQQPRLSALQQAASRNGWPIEMFLEGGPEPREVVNRRTFLGRGGEGRPNAVPIPEDADFRQIYGLAAMEVTGYVQRRTDMPPGRVLELMNLLFAAGLREIAAARRPGGAERSAGGEP